jgi:hypothetical protein
MKKLLIILFPAILTIACSLGVWANEQSAAQPACDKCAKVAQNASCEKCAKDGTAGEGCDRLATLKDAEGKPCGGKGCDKRVKLQQAEKKPCCDKGKPE